MATKRQYGDIAQEDEQPQSPDVKRQKAAGAPCLPLDQLQEMVKDYTDDAAATATAPTGPPVDAPTLTQEVDATMFYPDTYKDIERSSIVSKGDPIDSTKGGGKMLWTGYLHKNGSTASLCYQAPKLFLPAGISEYSSTEGDGRKSVNALCSLGENWQQNPDLVGFKTVTDTVIMPGLVDLIMKHNLHLPYCKTYDDVVKSMTPMIFVSEKEDDKDPSKVKVFPPSIKLHVGTASQTKSVLTEILPPPPKSTPEQVAEYSKNPRFIEISYSTILKGTKCSIIPMISVDWIYRKKLNSPARWSFNVHCSIYQGVIFRESGNQNAAAAGKVVIKT